MYNDRILTSNEQLYESRAQQKIAELTAQTSEELSRNDVDDFKVQLALELRYSIDILHSSLLGWTEGEIQMMMDYYSLRGDLLSLGYVDISYTPISGTPGADTGVSQEELNRVEEELARRDQELQDLIEQEILDRIIGDQDLQDQINLIGAGGALLTSEIVSQVVLGQITVGQVFPVGTPLEDIIRLALSAVPKVSNLTFSNHENIVAVDDSFSVAQFMWDVEGIPTNMVLSDNLGILSNVPVSGGSYTPGAPVNYPCNTSEDIVWTLTGDDGVHAELKTKVRYPVVFGKKSSLSDDNITDFTFMITTGTKTLQDYSEDVTVLANTANNEMGMIAVPDYVDEVPFSKWEVDTSNHSIIAPDDFIYAAGNASSGGVNYVVYAWNYRSPLSNNIKLHNE